MARIMIVDDGDLMRKMLRETLTEIGHEVVAEATTGAEAVDMYQEVMPELVTMDITMPDMDGIEAVKAIRAFDPDAKIIMCSAMGQQTMVREAIQAGAKDFIIKPFLKNQLHEAIQIHL